MRIIITFLTIIIICTLNGCTNRSMKATETPPATPPTPITPTPSVINIPAEIKTAFIEKAINEQLAGTIYRNNAFPVENLGNAQITVRKNGHIKIRATGNELTYKIPLNISIRFSFTILGHTEHKDVDAGITIALRSKYTLKNNWTLATTTTVDGYEWTSNPTIKIRFIIIPIKPIADFIVSKQSGIINDLGKMIDNAMAKGANAKDIITPIWTQLQTPTEITIPDMPQKLWLRFNPSDIYITQITGKGSHISAIIGIRAITETFIGDKPQPQKLKPLPNFKTQDTKDSTFTINLYAELPFEHATAICRETFVGKTLKSGRQKVLVHDIEISGENGLAQIKMNLSGSIKGTVNVTGHAIYNEKNQTLTIDNFNFDVESKSKYQKTRNKLLKGIIMSKMKPHMKFPLDKTLEDAKTATQKMLSNYEIYKGVTLNGNIDALTVQGVEVTDNGFRAVVTAKGTASVKVRE